jgi:hypothetical protein
MKQHEEFILAVIQADPVYFDTDASTEKACSLIEEAGHKGAALIAFGETWLPGYPHMWFEPFPADVRTAYLANAVEIPSPATDRLCKAANRADLDVVIGVVERDSRTQGTTYCTVLFIGREGVILGRHRKLKPTANERAIWGDLGRRRRSRTNYLPAPVWSHQRIELLGTCNGASRIRTYGYGYPDSHRRLAYPFSPVRSFLGERDVVVQDVCCPRELFRDGALCTLEAGKCSGAVP